MPIILPEEQASFEICPADSHVSICYRIIDLGTQYSEFYKKTAHKIMVSWELPNALMTKGEHAGKPFTIHKRYTFSSSENSNLRAMLESWRGVPFTKADFGKFDIAVLIGKACLLGVVHETKNNKTREEIKSIMRLPKGMTAPPMVNLPVQFNLAEFNQDVYDSLSEGIKATIAKSPEYQHLKGGNVDMGEDEAPPPPAFDDSVPF